MCLRGKRWREAQVHWQDENKWTASWWEQQRQRRWNWFNQSFILFPPICCVVIGVRVTGRMTSSSPTCLNTYTCPHTHLHCQTRLCILCLGSWGKRLWLGIYKKEEHKPSFTDRDAISTGAVGGYQGDSSTSTLPRWLVWHCHLSPKTCMCCTQLRVLPWV